MSVTDRNPTPEDAVPAPPALLERMGGPAGVVCSAVPVVVLVVAGAVLSPPMATGIAVAAGLAVTGLRLLYGERFSSATGGLLAVAAALGARYVVTWWVPADGTPWWAALATVAAGALPAALAVLVVAGASRRTTTRRATQA
jgi:hypothetical protein